MKDTSIRVSIIMGIYNCVDTLEKSIDSILSQTFRSWELIMCDDGSSDDTYTIAKKYQCRYSDQIKLIRNTSNKGLNYTLNRCLELAQGEYIARQDGDDTSLPRRLELEVQAMEQHPDMAVVSTAMVLFDNKGKWGQIVRKQYPQKEDLIRGTPFAHAPCLIRSDVLRSIGGYSEHKRLMRVEDYHLWYKLYRAGYQGMNLQEVLYQCLDDRSAQNRRKLRYRINECYIRWLVFIDFGLPMYNAPMIIFPLLVGLLPSFAYSILHKAKFTNLGS